MKICFVIVAFGLLSFGCATRHEEIVSTNLISGDPVEQIIRERLQPEPIPLPATTPFDSDAKKQAAYLNGFRKAWDDVVSGAFLHATIGVSIPDGLEEPWRAGWKDGCKIAVDRWFQELKKWRKEYTSPPNSSP
jgi:hypothetical protein